MSHNVLIIHYFFETVNNAFESEVWISNDFLKCIYQISIEYLVVEVYQTAMMFFDQFKVPTIKFGKCYAEFMIPIAFLEV